MTQIWFLKEFGLYNGFIDTSICQPLGPARCIVSLVKQYEGKQLQSQKGCHNLQLTSWCLGLSAKQNTPIA